MRWWEEQGFFQRLWQAGLHEYDELAGIGWDWQSLHSSTVKAPFAQAAVGPAPSERGKEGTKRSILCDRRGIPLALLIQGANRHAMKLVSATLHAQGYPRAEPTMQHPHNLCLDAGYDYDCVYGDLSLRGYEPHARLKPHNHKWYHDALKRSRRLLIRWEKLSAPYEAFLKLACALICFHQADRLTVSGLALRDAATPVFLNKYRST